jgi:hypothetical protein
MDGVKYDFGKADWSLMPFDALEDVVRVLEHGAKKYEPDNWKRVPDSKRRYKSAALRHIIAYALGRIIDKESGLPHLAHAICCLLFAHWFDMQPRTPKKKVYISGPITGHEATYQAEFAAARGTLTLLGYDPVMPTELSVVSKYKQRSDYMREDLIAMCDCDFIYLLPGWEESRGARDEVYLAKALDIPELKI